MTDYVSFYNNQTSADPTRTLSLRSRWVADWNRRIARLKRAVWQSVVANDAFGLREDKSRLGSTLLAQVATPPLPVAQPKQWAYRWSHEKVEAFMSWLKEMESRSLLEVTERPGTLRPGGEPWSNVYVRSAYQSGLRRAMDEVNRRSRELGRTLGLTEDMLPPTFHPTGGAISAVMKQPFHADRLALAYTRVFDELKGVTAEMDKQISRALAMGIAEGQNPRDIGETIARRIEAIGETRGRLIARTETIHIHQQAALNEYYAVEEYTGETMLVQWKATMDSRTRDKHAERNMRVYTKEEAYKLIGEPNCRCALLPWIPSVQGMPEKATAAARAACEKALKEAGKEVEKVKEKQEKLGEFSSINKALEWANKKYPNITWDFNGCDMKTLNPTLKQFDFLAKKYPEVADRLRYIGTYLGENFPEGLEKYGFSGSAESHYAHAHPFGRSIGLNPKWYRNADVFKKSLQDGSLKGWHPKGCDGFDSVLTHEFGHCVESFYKSDSLLAYCECVSPTGLGLYGDTMNMFMKFNKAPVSLSQYATTNDQEGFAEGFAAIYHSPSEITRLTYVKRLKGLLKFFQNRPELTRESWNWYREATEEAKDGMRRIRDFFVRKLGFRI